MLPDEEVGAEAVVISILDQPWVRRAGATILSAMQFFMVVLLGMTLVLMAPYGWDIFVVSDGSIIKKLFTHIEW